jgi:hypothetical protein
VINLVLVRQPGVNIGNDVIDWAQRRLLREAFAPADVNFLPIPAGRAGELGDNADLRAESVDGMNRLGHGVVVGSGNVYENGRLAVDLQALRALRPPLALLGLSHGRTYTEAGELAPRSDSMPDAVIAELHRHARFSSVRDDATRQHLEGLGLDGLAVIGCPTLLTGDLRDQVAPAPPRPTGALISLRSPELMSVPAAHRARVAAEVRRIADALTAGGHNPVRLLCHDPRDVPFAASFVDLEYLIPDDVSNFLQLMRFASVVVTFRLHAFLPCLALGTPVVNLSYDERSTSMLRTLGLGAWDVNFVGEPDAASEVEDRLGRLEDFTDMRLDAHPTWERLAARARAGLASFAEDVWSYASSVAAGNFALRPAKPIGHGQ